MPTTAPRTAEFPAYIITSTSESAGMKLDSKLEPVRIPPAIELEPHYSVQQVARLWGLGVDKVRELFCDELGVIGVGQPETRFKRGYITLRIPESVVRRVHTKLRVRAS